MSVKQMIQSIDCINYAYTNFKWRERKVSFGNENPDKEIYVARRANSKAGLFSLIITSIGQIQYAIENGYSPVVDLSNYGNDTSNIWDYYFEQPSGISLDEMRRSSNVILGNGIISRDLKYPGDQVAYSEQELGYWKKISREHLRVKEGILKEAEQLQNKLFSKEKVLGVLARGTDYINTKPHNHPVQPTVEQLIERIDFVVKEQNCSRIYLATEDADIYNRLSKKYGSMMVAMDIKRYATTGKENINDIRKEDNKDAFTLGKEYLLTILLLSRCHYLVAGNTSGTIGALLLNEKYEYRYIFDLGTYK